ncbi:aldehyde dehydrogenase [Robbsia andropogonis]|uniref:aldehyde dehydrogenase (NAD(+)) n=1 Tax=Robbsia andropogonis TaxID=28092 RepID=A0A0F5K071_9BURK|nr:aldehyde dehydrogenase family protein [Robbsia andropogonis]KKB62962.1 aldehyde dehydrogenase [Robbsia andropogonis]MCP1117370.1 aldehyde dehydrogenase family protein [Robbsia andropogonis]MCP1129235.1 aldehyde dehydrogenase family protein [Robbsia andropogonis]
MTTLLHLPCLDAEKLAESVYVGGQWRAPEHGGGLAEVINPATEASIGDVALGTAHDVDMAVSAALSAFPDWSMTEPSYRAAILEKVHRLILERKEEFARAISMEMGAPIDFARMSQVPLAAEHVRVARDVVRTYPFVQTSGSTAIAREAIGVCALITPWNWPLYQITAKVAPALAAGCAVVLKPSELAPLSAMLFAQVVHDAGVPAGIFNMVLGSGAEVGEALAAHPDVDMVSITGSNRAGALVAQAAAPTFKRVTQELGGKSPNVFLPDADFVHAVPKGVMSGFRNAGQSCSAPTRMLVPRNRLAEVEALALKTVESMTVGDPSVEGTVLGPIANAAQYGRVQMLIEEGMASGARRICGGPGRPDGMQKGFFARATIFSDVTPSMRIAQEEIFGPVLCIMPYDSVDEAVAIANSTSYGLGAHVQSRDLIAAKAVAGRIRSGQVHINYPAWDAFAPFGGYKRSGNGREYGVFGLEEYLETKAILGYVEST